MEIITAAERAEISLANKVTLEDEIALFEKLIQSYSEHGDTETSKATSYYKEISKLYKDKGYQVKTEGQLSSGHAWVHISWEEI